MSDCVITECVKIELSDSKNIRTVESVAWCSLVQLSKGLKCDDFLQC
jgi:hypothetical protein